MKVPRQGQREKTVGLLLIASSLLVSALAVAGFALSLKGMVDKRTIYLMSDAVQQYAQTVTANVLTKLNATTTIADILGDISTTDPKRMKTIMNIAAHQEPFRRVVTANLTGKGLTHKGEVVDMSDNSCFQKAAQGEPVICDALACSADKTRILMFSVPIKTNQGIQGVLSCEYELSLLESTTKTDRYFGEAYGMVVDSNGMPITWEQHKNIMTGYGSIMGVFSEGTMMGGMTLEQLQDNMANRMSGTFSIEYMGQNRLVSYMPLGINDWYAFCFASFAIYQQETVEVSKTVTVLVVEILLGLGAVFLYIMRSNRRHSRQITEANTRYEGLIANVRGGLEVATFTNRLAEMEIIYVNAGFTEITGYTYEDFWTLWDGKLYRHIYEKDWEWVSKQIEQLSDDCWEYSMEYRIVHKDGRIIWVMDRGRVVESEEGVLQYQSVLTDISVIKEQQERLAISEERFRIAIESADNIMFDYDCTQGIYVDFANSERMIGKTKEQINNDLAYTHALEERQRTVAIAQYFYHPDDFDMVMEKSLEALEKGEVSFDTRVRNGGDGYFWCRIHLTIVCDIDGMPYHILGFMGNIDVIKRQAELFKARSEKDTLTGFYNKGATVDLINNALSNEIEIPHTLFVMDIDNFKTINDTMGHLAGDAVIAETAERIRGIFRGGDILGRVGGDEFVVLIQGVSETDHIIRKATEIIEAFNTMSINAGGFFNVSVSIGIDVCRERSNYEEVFMRADKALYQAKRSGKNRYVFYDQSLRDSNGYTCNDGGGAQGR